MHILARALIIDRGYMLLCRSTKAKHPFYFLPGGHVELGETPEQALIRELQEELGVTCVLSASFVQFEYHFEPTNGQKVCHTHELNIVFSASSPHLIGNIPLVQREDHIAVEWIALDVLTTIDLKPEALHDIIKVSY